MKKFLLGSLILLFACNSAKKTQQSSNIKSLQGQWELQLEDATALKAPKKPMLNFNTDSTSFSGNTGCNLINGRFQSAQPGAISFNNNMATTRMACMEYNDNAFTDKLLQANKYVVKENLLQLLHDGTVLFTFTKVPG
ncbi:META domain-containing protein [Chitinophagaceae bacterium LWZ2-11]